MQLKWLAGLFLFTRKERNGILILLLLLLLSILINLSIPYLFPSKKYDLAAWEQEINRLKANHKETPHWEAVKFTGTFDPNQATDSLLRQLDIPVKIAAGWIKYLERGGKFRKKEEVMKIYGMNESLYKKMEPHLLVRERSLLRAEVAYHQPIGKNRSGFGISPDSMHKTGIKVKMKPLTREINEADSATLEALPGIGSVLASRIVKYRNLLGGFYEVRQLKEVYGMSEELFAACSSHLTVDTMKIKKIDLNFLSLSEMGRHPYIGFKQARRLVKNRDRVGKFEGVGELTRLFSTDSLQHLLPYLTLNGKDK